MVDYKIKLKALLHDPVHKIWAMKNVSEKDIKNLNTHCIPEYRNENVKEKYHQWHEIVAEDIFRFIFDECIKDDNVKIADAIASAISRIVVEPKIEQEGQDKFEKNSSVSLIESEFIDIFSLERNKIGIPESHVQIIEIFEKLGNLTFKDQKERAKQIFLFLWRFLPDIFPWIECHPADSRAPNHSIYDHLVQTSAIVSCLPKPAFLLFTIGPVQEFISTARKTSDLWAGSYILSYLIYKAIENILEELGPDNIVYPCLLGQPLVDKWINGKLRGSKIIEIFKEEKWFKKFIDNFSLSENLTIANFPNKFLAIVPMENAKKIADKCKENIQKELQNFVVNLKKIEIFKEQGLSFDNEENQKTLKQLKSYFQIYYVYLPWFNSNIYDIESILSEYENLVGKNDTYELIELIKNNNYYKPANVGVAYSLLFELTEKFLASRKMFRRCESIEEQKWEKCHLCGDYDVLNLQWDNIKREFIKENERLCGVCFIKRLFPEILKQILELPEGIKYPSTSEMATVLYKKGMNNEEIAEFLKKFKSFVNIVPQGRSVPALKENKLFSIDGEWLFEESYSKEKFEKEFGVSLPEHEFEEIIKFLREIVRPSTYYGILMMDGDEMGKWLKGEKMPKINEVIHSKVKEALLNLNCGSDEIKKILNSVHPISASIHQSFSKYLKTFALEKVKKIVEEKYYGVVVYAGGDDLLAFLPFENILECSYELKEEFKAVLGNKASMSAGITIAHHKYPLSLALDRARKAEKIAKTNYGRDAFCIIYLSRGGEERKFGGKWDKKDYFIYLANFIKNEKISKGFAYEIFELIEKIEDLEIIKIEAKRILKRKFRKEKVSEVESQIFLEKFLENLEYFKDSLKDFGNMLIVIEKIF